MSSVFDPVVAGFNESDPEARLGTLASILADDAEVVDIRGVTIGPAGFAEHIASIRADLGDAEARLEGEAALLHGWASQAWSLAVGGAHYASGVYTARLRPDGRITHLLSLPDHH